MRKHRPRSSSNCGAKATRAAASPLCLMVTAKVRCATAQIPRSLALFHEGISPAT